MNRIMPFILPWWACVAIVAISGGLVAGQTYAADWITASRTARIVSCEKWMYEIPKSNEGVVLRLSCDDNLYFTYRDGKTILRHVLAPRPLECTVATKANSDPVLISCKHKT